MERGVPSSSSSRGGGAQERATFCALESIKRNHKNKGVAGKNVASHVQFKSSHVIVEVKMAAAGEEASSMDSIIRVPAPPAVLNLRTDTDQREDVGHDGASENVVPAPRKTTNNNDGGVETAEEATEPAEPDINELCRDMFDKMAVFLQGELTATCEDYKLLENMNKLTSLKYMEMKDISINISRNLQDLNQKYASLQPYLDQINQIEEQVTALEQAAYKLDTYSKKLELKMIMTL
ncbi:hypothetical protein NFI96_015507 [Prochilodus magdalenae]|nr:hypothetical protein NFI96_015507 [Prochilodus magdalenae]